MKTMPVKLVPGYYKRDINYRSTPCCYNCNNCMSTESRRGKCSIVKDYATNAYVDSHWVCDHWEGIKYMEDDE